MSLSPGMGSVEQLSGQVGLLTEALRLERERNRAAIGELVGLLKEGTDVANIETYTDEQIDEFSKRARAAITKHDSTTEK